MEKNLDMPDACHFQKIEGELEYRDVVFVFCHFSGGCDGKGFAVLMELKVCGASIDGKRYRHATALPFKHGCDGPAAHQKGNALNPF